MTDEFVFMKAIEKLERDPDNEQLPIDALAHPTSMWSAALDLQRRYACNEIYPDIFDIDSVYHPSRLMRQQKLAIAYALGYIYHPDARDWKRAEGNDEYGAQTEREWDEEAGEEGDKEGGEEKGEEKGEGGVEKNRSNALRKVAEARLSLEGHKGTSKGSYGNPSMQCQVEPPGAGKTLVMLYIALLSSHNALIMTNSRDNAVQVMRTIFGTNIWKYFPVKMLRPSAQEDGTLQLLGELKHCVVENVASSTQTSVLDHGGVHGIVVIDVMMFQNYAGSKTGRVVLRTSLFRTRWDIFLVDEADAVFSGEVRASFKHGVLGEPLAFEPEANASLIAKGGAQARYRLQYKKFVAMSGTWHRGDAAGYDFLKKLGPITFSITSRELEKLGHLAKMNVALVRCVEERQWVQKYNDACKTLSAEKLRVCEKLVRFHSAFGHKIMVFSNRHWHLRMLERLFPFAISSSGESDNKEFSEAQKRFLKPCDQNHPLVWVTITKGQIGFDVQDACVVINLVNAGESAARLRQRMGRASRKLHPFGWFYDLVDDNEADWAPGLAGASMMNIGELEKKAQRYSLLFKDGYGEDLTRITSAELDELISNHVSAMVAQPASEKDDDDDDDEMLVKVVPKLVNRTVLTRDEYDLATIDHVATCVWGKFYQGEKERCAQTLFDTQSELRKQHREKRKASAAKGRASNIGSSDLRMRFNKMRNDAKKQRASLARDVSYVRSKQDGVDSSVAQPPLPPTSATVDAVAQKPVLQTAEDYAKYKMSNMFLDDRRRAAVSCVLKKRFGRRNEEDAPHLESASGTWTALMAMRAEVNRLQYQSDKERRAECKNLFEFRIEDEGEKCTFLHS